jgi:hypothetical protein
VIDEFTYKTYRCVWATECYEIDQYGTRMGEIFYTKDWPTRKAALEDLKRVAVQNIFTRNWMPKNAPHGYCEAGVSYHERLVK